MGLFDDIKAEAKPRKKPCSFGRWVSTLEGADRDDVLRALADPAVATLHITRATNRYGFGGSNDVVHRHRYQECNCEF